MDGIKLEGVNTETSSFFPEIVHASYSALKKLYDSKELRDSMGQKARERAVIRISENTLADY